MVDGCKELSPRTYILVLVFSLYPPLWAVVSAVAAFLTLGVHVFIVHVVFLCLMV